MELKTNLNDFYFPVEIIDNPNNSNVEYSKIVRGILNDNEVWDLNYCSPRYELVKNDDIFPNIQEVLYDNKIGYSSEFHSINNVRFYANFKITDPQYRYTMKGTNDQIFPMLKIQHSYNGATKYMISFGYFRMVCSNGLTIPVNEMKRYNLAITGKHTVSIINSFKRLDDMLKKFVNERDIITLALTAKYEQLNNNFVYKPQDRVIEVLEGANISIIKNKKVDTVQNILDSIMIESNDHNLGYDGRVTDWLVYNGINQYIYDKEIFKKTTPDGITNKDKRVLSLMTN